MARERSFTRAAAALGTSVSNLSHTIRRAEARVGHRLLQRDSRSVAVTEAGGTLLAAIRPALDGIASALERLEQGRDMVSGTLRLTMTMQSYDAVVRPILPGVTQAHPAATIDVVVDTAFHDIVAEQLDAGIRLGEKVARDMIAQRVGPALSMAVVASPDYLAGREAVEHPNDLVRHCCINYRMVTAGLIYAWEFERGGETLALRVSGPLTVNEPGPMLHAALDGLGIGYVLDHEAAPHIAAGRLLRLLVDWAPPVPGLHVYYSSRRQMRPVLRAFLDAVRHRG